MRARTITIMSLLVCAFAIPATASAKPVDSGYSAPTTGIGSSASEPASRGGSGGSPDVNSGYSDRTPAEISHQRALMSTPSVRQAVALERRRLRSPKGQLLGALADTPVSPYGEPPSDGFDWGSAAVGAGAAMALVALGGAGFLTVRRRTAVSPSGASTS